MLSPMPKVLPLALPSNTATMTPAVSSSSAPASILLGTLFSTNTATAATTTGMDALQGDSCPMCCCASPPGQPSVARMVIG